MTTNFQLKTRSYLVFANLNTAENISTELSYFFYPQNQLHLFIKQCTKLVM